MTGDCDGRKLNGACTYKYGTLLVCQRDRATAPATQKELFSLNVVSTSSSATSPSRPPPPISIHPYPMLLLLLDPGNETTQVPRPALSLFPQPVLTSSTMTSRRSSTPRTPLFHFVFLKLLLIRDVIGRTTTNGKPSQLSLAVITLRSACLVIAITLQSTSNITSPDSALAHHLPTRADDILPSSDSKFNDY